MDHVLSDLECVKSALLTDALFDVSGSDDVPGEASRTVFTAGGPCLVLVLSQRTQNTLSFLLLAALWTVCCKNTGVSLFSVCYQDKGLGDTAFMIIRSDDFNDEIPVYMPQKALKVMP